MANSMPVELLSIVTIHLNDFNGLQRTLNSLATVLGKPGTKWIFVDGGSDPATEKESSILSMACSMADAFVCEPDEGIYHAMNKGTGMARGEYLLYLNAGDELQPGSEPSQIVRELRGRTPVMIWGNCLEQYLNGETVPVKTRSPRWAWYGMPAQHPAILFRREALGSSPYDTAFRVSADYDLVCRLLKHDDPVLIVDEPMSVFHHGGVSDVHGSLTRWEENQVRLKYFGLSPLAGRALMTFKSFNQRLSKWAWFRRIWRSRI